MYRAISYFLLLSIIVMGTASCYKRLSPSGISGLKYSTVLPSDWPIPHLLFNNNMTITAAPSCAIPFSPESIDNIAGDPGTAVMWMLYIRCNAGESAIISDVEHVLSAEGYEQYILLGKHGERLQTVVGPIYYSPDGCTSVSIVPDYSNGAMAQQLLHPSIWRKRPKFTINNAPQDFQVIVIQSESQLRSYLNAAKMVNRGRGLLEPVH